MQCLHATAQLPFDAAEDEGSGGETLCGFVGRRPLLVCHTSRGWMAQSESVCVCVCVGVGVGVGRRAWAWAWAWAWVWVDVSRWTGLLLWCGPCNRASPSKAKETLRRRRVQCHTKQLLVLRPAHTLPFSHIIPISSLASNNIPHPDSCSRHLPPFARQHYYPLRLTFAAHSPQQQRTYPSSVSNARSLFPLHTSAH